MTFRVVLDPKLVRQARLEELQEIHGFKVYEKVPISECIRVTGRKPIGCRWSDTNKGDQQNPKYRSRLCAKEFKATDPNKAGCFAATPPLEALRFMISLCMTEWSDDIDRQRGKKGKWKLLFMDAARAHFHSPVREAIYVDLCPEEAEEGFCMKLLKSMYGTRQAASNWEHFYAEVLRDAGFIQGVSNPCLFLHPERRIRVWVHGDDFVMLGVHGDLLWAENCERPHQDEAHRSFRSRSRRRPRGFLSKQNPQMESGTRSHRVGGRPPPCEYHHRANGFTPRELQRSGDPRH